MNLLRLIFRNPDPAALAERIRLESGNTMLWQYGVGVMDLVNFMESQAQIMPSRGPVQDYPGATMLRDLNAMLKERKRTLAKAGFKVTISLQLEYRTDLKSFALKTVDQ